MTPRCYYELPLPPSSTSLYGCLPACLPAAAEATRLVAAARLVGEAAELAHVHVVRHTHGPLAAYQKRNNNKAVALVAVARNHRGTAAANSCDQLISIQGLAVPGPG